MLAVIALVFALLSFGPAEDQGRRQTASSQQPTPTPQAIATPSASAPQTTPQRGPQERPSFAADYTLHHISLDPMLLRNISTGYYEAGHMMYIDEKSLVRLRADVGKFIEDSQRR
jgi:hypothetical protein